MQTIKSVTHKSTLALIDALSYNISSGKDWIASSFKVPLLLRHNSLAMRKNFLDQVKDKDLF